MERPTSSSSIDIQRRRIEHELYKSTLDSVHRKTYTPKKLLRRRKEFPFHENLKEKDRVATAAVPGDSVFTQDIQAEHYARLAAKFPIIRDVMDGPPDDSVYSAVDPKRTPLSEYGAQYGYNPRAKSELGSAMKKLVPPSHWDTIPQTTQRYYHQNFNSPEWAPYRILDSLPIRIPQDNLSTDLSEKRDMQTEYMREISNSGADIIRDQYFGPPLIDTIEDQCKRLALS
ncbi:uncharacterized protein LOC103505472 isoform X2 [Diaphorina citri]|uniref:Uncharacterized protein LOC103505472 isoform X2 n=1 Tax=Diaphorina citri TaxID=121845 RepID=A0A3Q0IPL0_DIACI|nr:uncharacterized protein LOC103505472 isoform X2 [Diaphorina citri]